EATAVAGGSASTPRAHRADHSLSSLSLVLGLGGSYRRANCEAVGTDDLGAPWIQLEDAGRIRTARILVAAGRSPNTEHLGLDAAGLSCIEGRLWVDAYCRTRVRHIYGIGDIAGSRQLASSSVEEARRAVSHAYGVPVSANTETVPIGIYTIPEIAKVGLDETEARKRETHLVVGRADLEARGGYHAAAGTKGLLKLVVSRSSRQLLGVTLVGEGAIELVHLGRLAMLSGAPIDQLADTTFASPTLAAAYKVAALDATRQLAQHRVA
ncbi:MAG: FAD-dependent oxidoreductase, partial [Nannocystaceae bacterium]